MRPNLPEQKDTAELFRSRLENIIDMRHELVQLARKLDWQRIDSHFAGFYSENGRPGLPIRLMVGLHMLKHMYALSDEEVCVRWKENPYYQYFTGEEYFQHRFPIERSSMTHFRNRVSEEALEKLLQESLQVAFQAKALKLSDLDRVAVDTTVQEKAVTFPTDAKLMVKAIERVGETAKDEGIELRQSYVRVAKEQLIKSARYRHAKQVNRARKAEKKLRTFLGRLIRDIRRKTLGQELSPKLSAVLDKAVSVWLQQKEQKKKIFSWHAPEVECISKGKAHKRYEFGCKVTLATNVNPAAGGQFVLVSRALHGAPYDGHTLKETIETIHSIVGKTPNRIYVDKGYTGHDYEHKQHVFKSGQKRGVIGKIKQELKRRTVIEPTIGHMKNDGLLGRNYLKGQKGDKINAILAAVGFNLRQLLNWFRKLLLTLLRILFPQILIPPLNPHV